MKRVTLTVSLTVLDEVTAAEVREYVREAVEVWGGQRHPDDPLFSTEIKDVRVSNRAIKREQS